VPCPFGTFFDQFNGTSCVDKPLTTSTMALADKKDEPACNDFTCYCKDRPNGNYPNPFNPNPAAYIMCALSTSWPAYCDVSEGFDIVTSQCLPLEEATGIARTCGNGKVGSGLCPDPSECCSREGFCGSGDECGATCVGGPCESATGG